MSPAGKGHSDVTALVFVTSHLLSRVPFASCDGGDVRGSKHDPLSLLQWTHGDTIWRRIRHVNVDSSHFRMKATVTFTAVFAFATLTFVLIHSLIVFVDRLNQIRCFLSILQGRIRKYVSS